MKQYGERKWAQISEKLEGRVGKQCRERWHNHLRPDIKVRCIYHFLLFMISYTFYYKFYDFIHFLLHLLRFSFIIIVIETIQLGITSFMLEFVVPRINYLYEADFFFFTKLHETAFYLILTMFFRDYNLEIIIILIYPMI